MATDGPNPPACDDEIFQHGETIVVVDGSSNMIERWVKKVAVQANARLDWHYSGGRGNVLFLGDSDARERAEQAIRDLESEFPGTIMTYYPPGHAGLYRKGVTPVPDGAIAGFMDLDGTQQYIVEDSANS